MNDQFNSQHSINNNWCDFNNADDQTSLELIPKGTLAKVCMKIKPGGYDDASQGLTGGWATCSKNTGAIYLDCEFVVLAGFHAKRKVWSLIGLHSAKSDYWGNSGRSFIKAILSSARGIANDDNSSAAQKARQIADFSELNGIEFVARIDTEKDNRGCLRNVIKVAITPENKQYAIYKGTATSSAEPSVYQNTTLSANTHINTPSWK